MAVLNMAVRRENHLEMRKVHRRLASMVLLFLIVSLVLPLDLPAQDRYVISYGGFSGYQIPLWVTKDLGLLEKYKIPADVVMIPGSPRQMQALLGGSIHFTQTDATGPVTAFLRGADLIIVAVALNKFPLSVVTQTEIRQPADLAGKRIGIVNFGGQNELSILLALKAWKIPKEAVTIVPSGATDTRLLAMRTKAIDATVFAPPDTIKAEQLGFRILAHMSDLNAAFPLDAIVTHRSFLEKNRGVVKRFLQAYLEGIRIVKSDKQRTVNVYQKMLKQPDRLIMEKTFDYYAPQFSMPPRANKEGLRTTADFITQRQAGLKPGVEVERMLDESLLDELEREGFFNKLQ